MPEGLFFESALRGLVAVSHLRMLDIDRLAEEETVKIEQIVTDIELTAPESSSGSKEDGKAGAVSPYLHGSEDGVTIKVYVQPRAKTSWSATGRRTGSCALLRPRSKGRPTSCAANLSPTKLERPRAR
ncbi:MAG: hypothetical protein R2864_10510 [Syntrophotaleaceae bacterium]